jgi:tetrapyrrole methylase family protein/MazG family protein
MTTDAAAPFDRLLGIVRRLRAPEGCPWDAAQTPHSMRGSLVEELYECLDAIDDGDDANLREELGDLCLLVTLIAVMKEQEGAFSVADVLDGICGKLIRRHPHVFGDSSARSFAEVLTQWEAIKADEKGPARPGSALDGLPGSLPPLERALAVQRKAAKTGFDWPEAAPVWEKLDEEIAELREAVAGGDETKIENEVGDMLFTVVNLSRALGIDPGLALRGSNAKFERRFRQVESRLREEGTDPASAGLKRMDSIWNQLKAEESSASK